MERPMQNHVEKSENYQGNADNVNNFISRKIKKKKNSLF
jgi:hypothetical protein